MWEIDNKLKKNENQSVLILLIFQLSCIESIVPQSEVIFEKKNLDK